jgi:hypothetical protein
VDRFADELDGFAASTWGEATVTQGDASGLCLRATLALLARLERAGLADGVELWNLASAIEGKGRGAEGWNTHWVLVRDGEVIDVSARQFDPAGPHIHRGPAEDEFGRWRVNNRVDPDSEEMWCGGVVPMREIPPYWRDLLEVAPPGDLPGWPYPRHRLEPTSRWYAPEGS